MIGGRSRIRKSGGGALAAQPSSESAAITKVFRRIVEVDLGRIVHLQVRFKIVRPLLSDCLGALRPDEALDQTPDQGEEPS